MTPVSADLGAWLGRLWPAMHAQLGVTDGEPPPQFHRAAVGGTRLRKDGSIQLSRQDHQALTELASRGGNPNDPAWCARAAKAFDNVLTAQVERLPVGAGSRASHFRGKIAAVEGAKAAVVMTVGSGGVAALHPLTDPYLRAIYDMTRSVVDVVSQQAAAVMPDNPTGWQMGLLATGAAVSSGVPAAMAATRVNATLDRGVQAAWIRASSEGIRNQFGVADQLPAPDGVTVPGRGVAASDMLAAEGLAGRVAAMTGSDTRAVLDRLVQVPSVDRVETAVGMILDRSTLGEEAEDVRARAVDKVYLGLTTNRHLGLQRGEQAIDGGVEAILKASGREPFEVFPDATLTDLPRSVQDQAMNAALSGLPEAGRGSGSDGARSGPPAGGWGGPDRGQGRPGPSG